MSRIIVSYLLNLDWKKGHRDLSYTFGDYLVEVDSYLAWIKAALLGTSSSIPAIVSPSLTVSEFPRLMGPGFAFPWLPPNLEQYAVATEGRIQELTIHR